MARYRALDQITAFAIADDPSLELRRSASIWRVALCLAALIVGLLLLNNWHYIFHAELYENGDWASDAFFIKDAKGSLLLHGHYSRWGLHHPGPALFDTLALGEAVFFDWLHVVPTPLNGQCIALYVAMALFFSFALAIFAQRLGPARGGFTLFLPLALLFAVWHYGHALNGAAFIETWPVCPPILVFLCFLVAVASTASGGGRELPVVAVSGGWLVHNYLAQPLFLLPLTLLAYGGLLWWCWHHRPDVHPRSRLASFGAAWRIFPRAHLFAAGILLLFILPLLIDALHGSASNLSRILAHVRGTHEPPKELGRALSYFLIFGSDASYDPTIPYFGPWSGAGLSHFVVLHYRIYLCWLLTLLAPPVLFAVSRHSLAGAPPPAETREVTSTFIAWFYVTLVAAFILTLIWGIKQEGDMFYFNAYFNYSIYFGAALGLAGALAAFLQTLCTAAGSVPARRLICAALWLGAGVGALEGANHFKAIATDSPAERTAAHNVTLAAAATIPPGGVCFLDCDPWEIWPAAIAVALQLDRLGYQVRVNNAWAVMFGDKRTLAGAPVDLSKPIVHWRITPVARDPARLGRWPVLLNCGIENIPLIDIDPSGGRIEFGVDGNYPHVGVFGWAPADGDWTWSDQREGLLQFRPLPLSGDAGGVDMLIDAWSFADPVHPQSQRVEVVFNGVALGTARLSVEAGPHERVILHIEASLWRAAAGRGSVVMQFHFPDAKSPAELGLNGDTRTLGGGFRSIEFKVDDLASAK